MVLRRPFSLISAGAHARATFQKAAISTRLVVMRDSGIATRSNLTTNLVANSRGNDYRGYVRKGTPPKGGSSFRT